MQGGQGRIAPSPRRKQDHPRTLDSPQGKSEEKFKAVPNTTRHTTMDTAKRAHEATHNTAEQPLPLNNIWFTKEDSSNETTFEGKKIDDVSV
jgi:hypothetical protein